MSSMTTRLTVAGAGDAVRPRQKRAALTVAMLGFAVVALDAQITNVALPAIREHLGGGLSGLQWVVTGYTLMFSALLLSGGSMADRVGSKNGYRAGMVLFVLASLLCGVAPSLPVLIAARLVQGIGAALVTPTSLSLIREAFEDAQERARAIALWAVGGSVAAFAAFLAVQARSSHAMAPLALFRSRAVVVTLAVAFITMAGFYGMVFLQSLYFQQQRGHSALVTGLLFLPMTALVAVLSYLAPRIAGRFGRLVPIVAGQLSTRPANWQQRAREALGRTEIMVLATTDPDSGTWASPAE